jgi:hypothetical protein
MDQNQIDEKYNQAAQTQMQYIENVSIAFRQKCDDLRMTVEGQISTLDPKSPDQTNQANLLKLKFKQDLDLVVEQYEKEMKRSFGNSLIALEEIYRQKELLRLSEIEKEVLTY